MPHDLMRPTLSLLIVALAVACQSAPQADSRAPSTTAGTTAHASGAPPAVRTDTTPAARASERPNPRSDEVTIALDRGSYKEGATATVRITSHSRDTLGYNPCSNRSVERKEGTRWVTQPEPEHMCTMELRLLRPGETQTVSVTMPDKLSAGTYRLVLTFSRQGASASGTVRAVSSSFAAP